MHLHFERIQKPGSYSDCNITDLSWMGRVPDGLLQIDNEGWKLNRINYYQDGWLATGNSRGIVGVTYTTCRCKKTVANDLPSRTNYNLRGHRSEVTLVKWNEPYQKLASCDSSGIIFVWIKYEGRWSIELINDRNTQVTDFSWSHDGRMALICYMDGFVLVGSVSGQRYWSSMLNLENCTISCGIWTPDDQQVIFGTSSGHILVIDVHGTMVAQVNIQEGNAITSMTWSCEKFKMEDNEDDELNEASPPRTNVLAVSFIDGNVYIMKNYDDIFPIIIRTGLVNVKIEWSNNGDILAIVGHKIVSNQNGIFSYLNIIQFYSVTGILRLIHPIDYTSHPITALTWGHSDKRLFIATGPVLHIAWVTKRIASLQLLSRLSVFRSLYNEEAIDCLPIPLRLKNSISSLFGQTIQCYLPDLKKLKDFVTCPPKGNIRLHCTMIRHDDDLVTGTTSYILYLEYLGGLVPILKGKRASKLKPEFVIFNPQVNELPIEFDSSSISTNYNTNGQTSLSSTPQHYNYLIPSSPYSTSSDSENEGCNNLNNQTPTRMRRRRRRFRNFRSRYNNNSNGSSDSSSSGPSSLVYPDEMPEQEKLVLVTSNIWGTKFKILSLVEWLPSQLGSINYRTSLLHLQPRQMSLMIKELGGMRLDNEFFEILSNSNFENNNNNINNNYISSDSEDEMAMSERFDDAVPIAPITPRKHIGSYQTQSIIVSPENRTTIQIRNNFSNNSSITTNRLIPSFTEEFLTLHLNDSNVISMEITRDQSTSSSAHHQQPHRYQQHQEPVQSSISTQTSFQSISELLNSLSFEKNTPTIISPVEQPQKSLGEQIEEFNQMVKKFASELPCTSHNSFNYNHLTNKHESSSHSPVILNSHLNFGDNSLSYQTISPNVSPPKSLRHKIMKKESPRKASISCLETDFPRNCDTMTSNKNQSWFGSITNPSPVHNWTSNISGGLSLMTCANSTVNDPLTVDLKSGIINDLKFIDDIDGDDFDIHSRSLLLQKNKTVCHLQPSTCDFTNIKSINEASTTTTGLQPQPSQIINNFASQRRLILKASKQSHSFEMGDTPHHHCSKEISRKFHSFDEEDDSINDSSYCTCKDDVHQTNRENNLIQNNSKCSYHIKNSSINNSAKERTFNKSIANSNYHRNCSEPLAVPQTPIRSYPRYKNTGLKERIYETQDASSSPQHPFVVCGNQHRNSLPQAILSNSILSNSSINSINSIYNTTNGLSSSSFNRSLPASPLSGNDKPRRKAHGKGLLYSPMMLRKVVKQKLNYLDCSSEDDNTSDDEDLSSSDFKDLESFQKAHFKKKFKIKRKHIRSRVQPENEMNNLNNKQQINYREFSLHNKAPLWNEVSQVYQLDFGGRVTQESAKNFQIEYQGKQVMQFGRIDGNAYTLDFQYPFSALQALAVALANVTQRLK